MPLVTGSSALHKEVGSVSDISIEKLFLMLTLHGPFPKAQPLHHMVEEPLSDLGLKSSALTPTGNVFLHQWKGALPSLPPFLLPFFSVNMK